jgi:hypothetical protein
VENKRRLTHPWVYKTNRGYPILGTNDHSELLYEGIEEKIYTPSENDVLVNFDPHHDVSGYTNSRKLVEVGNFVDFGSRPDFHAWGTYIQITPSPEDSTVHKGENNKVETIEMSFGSPDPVPENLSFFQFDISNRKQAMELALKEAKEKGGKIIVTLDLDTFGTTSPAVPYSRENTSETCSQIFQLIDEYSDQIKLVHISESGTFLYGDDQREVAYNSIIDGVNRLESIG